MTDTTMRAPAPVHVIQVVSDGFGFLAECGCGWASDWQDSPQDADEAGAEHRDAAVGPPDAMDLLMSGLLDLQDDLAATVLWLAENWSAHLPPLRWIASGDDRDTSRPAVRVLGVCDPGELAAAATVLGSVPVDDPPTHRGVRFRRAVRDIGRVRIEVIVSLDRCERAETAP
jgi:hypothetical protein